MNQIPEVSLSSATASFAYQEDEVLSAMVQNKNRRVSNPSASIKLDEPQ